MEEWREVAFMTFCSWGQVEKPNLKWLDLFRGCRQKRGTEQEFGKGEKHGSIRKRRAAFASKEDHIHAWLSKKNC